MADVKISQLPAATSPVASTDVLPVVQGGATKKTSIAQLGFLPAGTSAVTRTIQDKLRDVVSVKDFGAVGNGVTDDTAAIQAAIAASDTVFFNSGTYLPVTISASNKTLIMDGDVEFRLPNGTVGSSAVTGPAVFHVSGSNVTIEGNFTVNGNRANNSSYSIPTTVRIASLYVTGNNVKFNGEVYVKDAYWLGFTAEGGSTTGTEITGLYINNLRVEKADYHTVLMWSVADWHINSIVASGNVSDSWLYGTKDQRIRVGTQLSNTSKCKNGSVNSILSDKYVNLTIENGAENIAIGTAIAAGGGKLQNVSQVAIQTFIAADASLKNEAYGFALINASKCHIGTCIVANYDCNNTFTGYAFVIDGASNCSIGSITVSGSLATAANALDMIITGAKNVHIGQISLTAPSGTLNGFMFDYDPAYSPQENIVIDSLISTGHTTWDVSVDNPEPILIRYVNPDAVFNGSSKLNVYPQIAVLADGVTPPASATSLAKIYVDGPSGDLKIIFADGVVKTIITDT